MNSFENITVAGSGVLGSQIAFQNAYYGKEVVVYDITEEALDKAKANFEEYKGIYANYFQQPQKAEAAIARIKTTTDLAEAVKNADLLIEAIPEVMSIKTSFFENVSKVAPEKTVFATNSSTMVPSQFAASTDRPEKLLAMHFANEIWIHNTAEIMGHAGTDPQYITMVVNYAKEIGLIPFQLKKEQPGYILNSLLIPLLDSSMHLWVSGVADPQTIDKDWMVSTGMPIGPFGILDEVGMKTQYNILLNRIKMGETQLQPLADKVKAEFIDTGKLGISTNAGFYNYPHPAYTNPTFLS